MRTPARSLPLLAVVAALVALLAPVPAAAAPSRPSEQSQTVTEAHYQIDVPASWPAVDLSNDPSRCYRVDRPAVFLGHPAGASGCPQIVSGRADTILIEPADEVAASERPTAVSAEPGQVPTVPPLAAQTHELRVAIPSAGVVVTLTWAGQPDGVVGLLANGRQVGGNPTPPPALRQIAPDLNLATPAPQTGTAAPGTAGATTGPRLVNGKGFDACSLPPASGMATLKARTGWTWAGFYLGGSNASCPSTAMGSAWLSSVVQQGWSLAPLWVGPQAPTSSCGSCGKLSTSNPSGDGVAQADAAVSVARSIGMGAGVPIYYDMESYARGSSSSPYVLSFLSAWTGELHRLGYRSGVYSSSGTGMLDLVADYNSTVHTRPDFIWPANWNGAATTTDPYIPSTMWANHQRLRQYASPSSPSSGHTSPINVNGFVFQYDADIADGLAAGSSQATANYVAYLYRVFLGRSPSSTWGPYWTAMLDQGMPRSTLVNHLLTSDEGLQRVIKADYTTFLRRSPSSDELLLGQTYLGDTHRNDVWRARLMASLEYYQRVAGGDRTQFVRHAYVDLLGRLPTASAQAAWVDRLTSGSYTRTSFTQFLSQAPETSERDVTLTYQHILQRAPSPSYLASSTAAYRTNFDLFPLEIHLGSTNEAFQLAQ